MTSTGVHTHELSPRRACGWLSPFLRAGACGLALTAGILGTHSSAQAEQQDPTKPRIEKVRDVDGSVWEVLIVPRPLYRPAPIHCPPGVATVGNDSEAASAYEEPMVPPAPEKTAQPKPKAKPEAKKPEAKKPEAKKPEAKKPEAKKPEAKKPADEAKPNQGVPSPPPPPQKRSPQDEQAGSLPASTEWIAFAHEKEKDAKPKQKAMDAKPKAKDDFGVQIVPRFSYPAAGPADDCCPPDVHPAQVNPANYWPIYQSIPFIRSEYVANPSYRHEATMEILFGQLRPTVIHKHPGQPRPHHTMFPFENDFLRPNSYYALGGNLGPAPVPFGIPGAYGYGVNLNYPGAQLSNVPWGFTIPYDLTPGY